jgi:alkylation response protein AidB-like acyl-CoA dehydrogenase
MMTVGVAQLTTSRQGGAPALRASYREGAWFLNGTIPWSTGPGMSPFIVAAAVAPEGQILFALEQHASGVKIEDYMDLVALRATLTTSLTLKNVTLDEKWIIRGPVENVLANRPSSLPLGQTFLGLGLCHAALDLIEEHDSKAAREALARLKSQFDTIRSEILALSSPGREPEATAAAPAIRGRLNDLTIRTAHAAVTLYKGSALLTSHPAQRLAREAMFMLVWSCPNPVIDSTVELLSKG